LPALVLQRRFVIMVLTAQSCCLRPVEDRVVELRRGVVAMTWFGDLTMERLVSVSVNHRRVFSLNSGILFWSKGLFSLI
jgi:hypothetical protein